MPKPRITIEPVGETVFVEEGEHVLETLTREGIHIEGPCNGQGICGKCSVWVKEADRVPETPHESISSDQAAQGLRLACQLKPRADLTIELPRAYARTAAGLSDLSWILVGEKIEERRLEPAVSIFRHNGEYRLSYDGGEGERLDWKPGLRPHGLALDIGTTTLVLSLLSLETGRERASAAALNPQTVHGHDVLSRVQKGSSPEGLQELKDLVQSAVNGLIEQVCLEAGVDAQEILDVAVGGNTTMLQLFAGIDPSPLGHLPFTVSLESGRAYPAGAFGLQAHPQARVYIPPVLHAFVGSDVSAGLAASQGFFEPERRFLFLDIGTNGEMALNWEGTFLASSTAAGPAFEGAGIHSGMRAEAGAVQGVFFNGEDLEVRTIGDETAQGICGSGLIDLLAALLDSGLMEPSGRIFHPEEEAGLPPKLQRRLVFVDDKPAVELAPAVYITQNDIRSLQLAKAAVRTGIDLLLQEADAAVHRLESIIIGGGFGNYLRPRSLEAIGMIPPGTGSQVVFGGNTSRLGCAVMLQDRSVRRELERRMSGVTHVSIAESKEFMDCYVENMPFPDESGEG
jgi:uncharacterized 2Fe-2S/4Fe-4S cluster protein (DUF4445 family)